MTSSEVSQPPLPEAFDAWVPPTAAEGPLTRSEVQAFSRLTPLSTAARLVLVWALVVASLWVAAGTYSIAVTLAAFVAVAFLQNHLVSWTHEASHYGLTRRKALNDRLADLFVSGPTGVSVAQYRWQHMRHHRHLGSPEMETDLSPWLCIRNWQLLETIVRHASGWFAWTLLRRYRPGPARRGDDWPRRSPASIAGLLGGNALLLALCAWRGRPEVYLLVWVAPLFTLTLLIVNLRTIVEHQPSSDVCDTGLVKLPPITRHVTYGPFARLLVAPVGFAYHFEHHLYPGVPSARLGQLRRRLHESGWTARSAPVRTRGYLATLWRLSREAGYGVRVPRPGSATADARAAD
jgi:fatty acid desaturase